MQPNAFTSGTCPSYKATVSSAWTERTEKEAKKNRHCSSLVTTCKPHKCDVFHSHHFCLLVLPIIVIVISLYCLPVPLLGSYSSQLPRNPSWRERRKALMVL